VSGETVLIPLNKLKLHSKNARKTPHSEASIEAKAASIAVKGMLQNLVVKPERDAKGSRPAAILSAPVKAADWRSCRASSARKSKNGNHPLCHRHGKRRSRDQP